MRPRNWRAAALACFSLSCSGDPEPDATRMWVGQVQNSDVKVGLAERGGAVVLFFCGGDTSYTTSTRWFADRALLTQPFSFNDAGWSVDGAMKNGSVSGQLRTDLGEAHAWTAAPVDPTTLAGLYDGVAPCGRLGLIVTQTNQADEPTGQGACLRTEGSVRLVEQVNPVRLEPSATRELQVTVPSEPDQRFTVRLVASVAK